MRPCKICNETADLICGRCGGIFLCKLHACRHFPAQMLGEKRPEISGDKTKKEIRTTLCCFAGFALAFWAFAILTGQGIGYDDNSYEAMAHYGTFGWVIWKFTKVAFLGSMSFAVFSTLFHTER